jgi:hypothetical protein
MAPSQPNWMMMISKANKPKHPKKNRQKYFTAFVITALLFCTIQISVFLSIYAGIISQQAAKIYQDIILLGNYCKRPNPDWQVAKPGWLD